MKKNIPIIVLLFTTFMYSQKTKEDKFNLSIIKSDKINLFDYSIFEPNKDHKKLDKIVILEEKSASKMPVFSPKGNYLLKNIKVDTINKYSLRIYKIE